MDNPIPVNGTVRIRPGRRLSLRQALNLQQLVYDTAFAEKARPAEIAQLARAWDVLEDRKRVLRGKPLPGSFKPEKVPSKREDHSGDPVPREMLEYLASNPAPVNLDNHSPN